MTKVLMMREVHLNRSCKITNVTCHWNLESLEENITVTVGSDSLVFKKGFWDCESIKKHFKTKSVDLEPLSFGNTCTIYHASEDVNLKGLGPYLGFAENKVISGGSIEISPNSVDLFKGLSMIEIRGNFVNRNINLDQGYWSSLLTRIPIDTKQVLNGSITTYQPWSSSPINQNTVTFLEFEVKDNSSLKNGYTLYVEMEFL